MVIAGCFRLRPRLRQVFGSLSGMAMLPRIIAAVGSLRWHAVGGLCCDVSDPPTGCHAATTLERGWRHELSLEPAEMLSKSALTRASRGIIRFAAPAVRSCHRK